MNKIPIIIAILCIFALGWFSSTVMSNSSLQMPFGFNATERPSPKDRISEDQIFVLPDKIIIYVEGASWAKYTDTNSMDNVFDIEANGLEIKPESPSDLQVGDIIAYKSEYGTIAHRIIKIGEDEQGWYCITKGDNLTLADPQPVRFDKVIGVYFAIIY